MYVNQVNRIGIGSFRFLVRSVFSATLLVVAACGSTPPMAPTPPTPPGAPTPPPEVTTANVYILPGATNLGPNAFGDEAIVIHKGERMRWRNIDGVEHDVVTDTTSLPEFMTTGTLAPGDEKSFLMNTTGTTKVHCTIHPQMTGTLIVQR